MYLNTYAFASSCCCCRSYAVCAHRLRASTNECECIYSWYFYGEKNCTLQPIHMHIFENKIQKKKTRFGARIEIRWYSNTGAFHALCTTYVFMFVCVCLSVCNLCVCMRNGVRVLAVPRPPACLCVYVWVTSNGNVLCVEHFTYFMHIYRMRILSLSHAGNFISLSIECRFDVIFSRINAPICNGTHFRTRFD